MRPIYQFFRSPRCLPFILTASLLSACTWTKPGVQTSPFVAQSSTPLPDIMADPLEPVNRAMWAANKGFLAGVMQPTARTYRAVVAKPVRTSINNFTHNIIYPGRALNHVLQGRWSGAGDETLRFLTNTTVGGLGFFDVASKWNMPKSEADFSETFGKWGWKPQTYVVMPFFGPSDDRHATGFVADEIVKPWNYAYPYTLGSYSTTYNTASDKTEEARRLTQAETDSYELVKYAWTYATKDQQPDWRVKGQIDKPTLQTLAAVRISYQDPDFLSRGKEISVRIPTTGRKLKFNYWLQSGTAPLVYISPGLSSHRLSLTTLSVAEHLHRNGFSVVTTTSVFHPEFMENASSAALPVYPPVDSRDLLVAMTEADRSLSAKYPGRFGKRALVGLSMGGFLTLRLAADENHAAPNMLHFDRYLAVNPPVDLIHGGHTVDAFQDAPLAWPTSERQALVNNTLHKATMSGSLTSSGNAVLPFGGIESKYLIGLTFRITLRDIIYSSQRRANMGVLKSPLSTWCRDSSYREIMKISYKDYFLKFAVPYYQKQGINMSVMLREGNLRGQESRLKSQPKVRVITNRNDFLLPSKDLSWLQSTLAPSQLTVFPDGGHLGNLANPSVQKAIIHALSGLE